MLVNPQMRSGADGIALKYAGKQSFLGHDAASLSAAVVSQLTDARNQKRGLERGRF
jgi:hypothetical protein